MMSKDKHRLANQINEGIDDYYKNDRKSNAKHSLKKQEFDKLPIELNPKQDILYKGIKSNILSIVHGPAGTGKTWVACYAALALLANKKIEKIIITKPIQESGEQLGHLPGTVAEKTEPFMKSYLSTFEKILGKQTTGFMISNEEIVVEPLAYMRGATYDYSVMLLDECQNATMKQLMLWSTRLGKESKAIMMGDTSQFDVKKNQTGYIDFIKMTNGMDQLFNFEFANEDIVRNKFLVDLTNRYDKFRSDEFDNNNN
jgi:phosphate starvation-inducible PhoH-like protein